MVWTPRLVKVHDSRYSEGKHGDGGVNAELLRAPIQNWSTVRRFREKGQLSDVFLSIKASISELSPSA